MTVQISPADKSRDTLRAELADTQSAYHLLLDEIPENAWEAPTLNPSWNVRQVMYHITMAVRLMPQDVKMIRSGRFITPPAWLFNWLNIWITRWGARGQSKQSLAQAYDDAHNIVVALLDSLTDDELTLTGIYPNLGGNMPGGEHTIADVFHYLTLHFKEHEPYIRKTLSQLKEQTP
ncbi:MAG: DinB family protein [Chloroflexota bacterium]|nr:DinB family protein [Chloroflexota bacterium]